MPADSIILYVRKINRGAVFMINAGGGYSPRGKGKIAEENALPRVRLSGRRRNTSATVAGFPALRY